MRYVLGPVAIFVLMAIGGGTPSPGAGKDTPIDGIKLIGVWEGKSTQDRPGGEGKCVVEFAKGDVIKVKDVSGKVTLSNEGKYKLDGNKLTIITELPEGKQSTSTATITKLTDDELEWRSSAGRVEKFKRVKEEKK